MHYQPTQLYPNNKMEIGQYLGLAVDVGNVMPYKILKSNGKAVHRSTLRPWTIEDEASPEFAATKKDFMIEAHEALGPGARVSDF